MSRPEPATETRAPLSRERVLETAVALADRHGLEWLSMRKLADELGVAAMSLYYHVPNRTALVDAVLGCLRAAGFSLEMTVHAYSVQDAYIYGFALQETDMASETPDDFAAEAQRQMREYEAVLAEYPHLVEVVGGYVAKSGYDYAAEFVFGLDLILDALDKRRDEGL